MKTKLGMTIVFLLLLTGCTTNHFQPVNAHQSFVASMNILQPSLTFYDKQGQLIADWSFEEAYTGAVMIKQDQVLLYGHQLTEAPIYELSSGKKVATLQTGLGTTNAYYAEEADAIFLTNSRTNHLMRYDVNGQLNGEIKLKNYPMSMMAHGDFLYVVNYKDQYLSVVNMQDLAVEDEWSIEKSSHGLAINRGQLLIGGHGEGMKANDTVKVFDLATGKEQSRLPMPLMPIGFAQRDGEVAVVSHGTNMLYVINEMGEELWHLEVGANPFAVQYFQDGIAVAGYDDDKLYFIQEGQVDKAITVKKGPFQLLVREVS